MLGKRGELTWDTLMPWIIGIVVLAIFIILYMTINSQGGGAITYIKNLLRFG